MFEFVSDVPMWPHLNINAFWVVSPKQMLMAPLSFLGYQIQADITPNVTLRYFFNIAIVMRVTEK
jgi:hypothetical protein